MTETNILPPSSHGDLHFESTVISYCTSAIIEHDGGDRAQEPLNATRRGMIFSLYCPSLILISSCSYSTRFISKHVRRHFPSYASTSTLCASLHLHQFTHIISFDATTKTIEHSASVSFLLFSDTPSVPKPSSKQSSNTLIVLP